MKNYLNKNSNLVSLFTLILIFVSSGITQGQVVNGYAKVTAIAGNTITISSVAGEINETADTFDNNDYIIIMQMQDNVIGVTADNSNFGNVGSIASAGLYEVRRIVSQTAGPPRVLTLDAPPANTYNIGANSSVQIITFRRFGSPNYTSTSNMSALAWNGSIGGVLAIDVQGVFTLAHNLSADGAGFRGAANDDNSQSGWNDMPNPLCEDNIFRTSYPGTRALKGEGIYKNTNPNYVAARGKMLNGGGGGNSHNGGGGGGGNYSAGGLGGWGWNCDVVNRSAGGQGGIGLHPYISANRVFMGGGGGAGERNNGFDSYGGNGGGIILLRAGTLQTTGACGTLTISANGANGALGNGWDGCGGGGAGGSIVLDVANWNVAATCPILVRANGGDGGSVNSSMHGGGGGGGQGVIFYSTPLPSNVSNTTTVGIGGCNNNANPCDRAANGENIGTNVFFNSSTPLPVQLVYFRAKNVGKKQAQTEWLVESAFNFDFFELERSYDVRTWEKLEKVYYQNTQKLYSYIDANILADVVYYRLKMIDKGGSFSYSPVVKVSFAKDAYLFVYPNPTQDKVFVETTEPEKLKQIYLHNIKGEKMTFTTKIENNKVILDLSHLSNGLYVLQLHFEDNFVTEKLAIQK